MVKISFVILCFIAATASGASIWKRIAQVIDQSTTKWEQACLAAGGGQRCNPQSIAAFTTLLAAAGPCDQQDQADNMIDLAKSLNNNANLIKLTQIFVQQPRNTPSSESVQYCNKAPRNTELNGLFQCQFAGANKAKFVGGVPVGSPGTIPFGHQTPLNPPGSCPANPSGPIPDGQQLVDITQNPGVSSFGGNSSGGSNGLSSPSSPPSSPSTISQDSATPTSNAGVQAASSGNFHEDNGRKAQELNAGFASLTKTSPCTGGQSACIGDEFAQCSNGEFATSPCAPTLKCFALPLVNKPGTSVTCTTPSDALARIQATGVQGGVTGA